MSPFTKKGLLNLENISKVLDKERQPDDYKALRKQLAEDESVLDANIKHWIMQEVSHLASRFPEVPPSMRDWVGHLLERYFIRGFYMCRAANAELLSGWFSKDCTNPPDREKITGDDVGKRD